MSQHHRNAEAMLKFIKCKKEKQNKKKKKKN